MSKSGFSMDRQQTIHARIRKGMRSQGSTHGLRVIRAHSSLPCAAQRLYGITPMKDLKSRILAFSFAIVVGLAAWGGFVYLAMHLVKK